MEQWVLVQPDQWPSLLQVWGAPQAKRRNITGATSSTQAEVHRPGQTEGGTAAEKLVKPGANIRPDYKDGGDARGLGKSLVVLIKVQDWLTTTGNNSIQDIPEFNREMEEKLILIQNSEVAPFQDGQDGWNTQHSLGSLGTRAD